MTRIGGQMLTKTIIGPAPKDPNDGDLWLCTITGEAFTWFARERVWLCLSNGVQTVITREQFEQWAIDTVTQ